MNTVAEKVASYLLDIKAIKLEPNHPFTWASGLFMCARLPRITVWKI